MNRLAISTAIGASLALSLAAPVTASVAADSPTPAPTSSTSVKDQVAAAQRDAGATHKALGLRADEGLKAVDVVTDADGTKHTRYDRTFKGLRVVGGDMIVTTTAKGGVKNIIKNASGKVAVASIAPKVARTTALAAGQKHAKGKVAGTQGELVVYAAGAKPVLAYDVLTTGVKADGQTPSRLHTYVDANTGAVLGSNEEVQEGTGQGIFDGTVTIGTTAGTGGYQMRDSVGHVTTDMFNTSDKTQSGTVFTDSDDRWGNGTNSDRASAGVDAHFGAEKTFDYYKNVLGRNGIWNDGRGARSRVHFGSNYVNAFWDGVQMTYGDGTNNAHPLTELDVAAHEMSHGVNQNSARLGYSGDAGGLNEANSDIFGTAVEWYANLATDTPDYLIGEEIDINGDGTPLRYMDKPSKDGVSFDCWSSTMGGNDPHYTSGPLNHWYYLASEGSGAKTINGVSYNSPTCGGAPAVVGAGHQAIEKIWYRTLATKLTASSSYKVAREGVINSAIELYGAGSNECKAVESAMNAIAVPKGTAACTGSTPPPDNPPTGTNLLVNPGFESGQTGWTGTTGPITNDSGRPAHSGSWKMWLGGNGTTATEREQQTVTIPATATSAQLSFYLAIDSMDSTVTPYDTMKVQVIAGGVTKTLKTFSNVDTTNGYVQQTFDLSAYKGQQVTVKFLMSEDSVDQTSFVVDDTALNAG